MDSIILLDFVVITLLIILNVIAVSRHKTKERELKDQLYVEQTKLNNMNSRLLSTIDTISSANKLSEKVMVELEGLRPQIAFGDQSNITIIREKQADAQYIALHNYPLVLLTPFELKRANKRLDKLRDNGVIVENPVEKGVISILKMLYEA